MKLTVEATKLLFDGLKRRRPGDVFELDSESQFSWTSMTPKGWTPKTKTKPKDYEDPRAIRKRADAEFVKGIKGRGSRKPKLDHDSGETTFVTVDGAE